VGDTKRGGLSGKIHNTRGTHFSKTRGENMGTLKARLTALNRIKPEIGG